MSRLSMFVAALLLSASAALAQGEQSGALSGRVSSTDGLSLPGATVTATSPALQGPRSAVADVNGVYLLRGLPPGEYVVRFEMSGLTTVERKAAVALGAIVPLDQTLTLAPVREAVDVRAALPPAVTTPAGATNLRLADAQPLPLGRTPFLIAELAPGLTDNTPNQTQVTIGGGFAYDNVFLMDGVDINDNVLGQPNNLFIEEALDEVQVLTSGIGAEYGRFGGGVVNVVTKSGGNTFSGAFRTNFSNPAWSVETPIERRNQITRRSKLSAAYEGVVGGPIARDRVWFFGATRVERATTAGLFQQTNIPFTSANHNRRYEAKVTATVRPGHTLQATFIDNATDLVQPALAASIDPRAMTTPSTPNRLGVATWRGVIGSRLFATAQYSQKIWNLTNAGNTSTDIHESPFLTRGLTGMPAGLQYNAPYFDSTDPETRNNRQVTATLSYLLGRRGIGSHELKTGFEYFVSSRKTGNSQTSTGYVFQTDYKLDASSAPALDASGRLIPRFIPGTTRMQTWMPVRGAAIDMTTASIFATDRWTLGPRLTADVGLRYEHASSDATNQTQKVSTGILMPRLAASYDLTGERRTVAQATFGLYTGTYNGVQFSRNSSAGNADRITGSYTGPAGEGVDFAPGFDPANYTTIAGTFPTVNIFFDPKLTAPHTRELTLALGRDLGHGAWARGTYVHRHATDFVEDFITIADGKTTVVKNGVNFGTFDNAVYRNTDLAKRDYDAVQLQSAWNARRNLTMAGQWTVQVRNDGNFEGEATNLPAIPSLVGDYPELYVASRDFPAGRVDDFQRHKVRVWASYGLDFGTAGRLDLAPMYRYNSARTFSYVTTVALSAIQLANNPGYARVPTSQSLFFGERGAGTFAGYGLVDFAATWSVPVWRSLRPWFKVEVLNLANNQKPISWDTTIAADNAGPKDANGLPLAYITGPKFGETTKNGDYPRPRPGLDGGRTYLMSFGLRF